MGRGIQFQETTKSPDSNTVGEGRHRGQEGLEGLREGNEDTVGSQWASHGAWDSSDKFLEGSSNWDAPERQYVDGDDKNSLGKYRSILIKNHPD